MKGRCVWRSLRSCYWTCAGGYKERRPRAHRRLCRYTNTPHTLVCATFLHSWYTNRAFGSCRPFVAPPRRPRPGASLSARRYNTTSSDQRAHLSFCGRWFSQTHTTGNSEAPRKLPGVCPFLFKAPKFPPTAFFRVKLFSQRLK